MIPSLPWFLYYGRILGMKRDEILCMRFGEMQDMIACHAIANGICEEKKPSVTFFDDALAMR